MDSQKISEFKQNCRIYAVNENTILLTWPEKICRQQHDFILSVEQSIKSALADKFIDAVTAFNSLQIQYAYHDIQVDKLVSLIEDIVKHTPEISDKKRQAKLVEIPVYYNTEAGWDLIDIAHQTNLSIEEIIKIHSSKVYRAYALGFTPGFSYLASLNNSLALPRRAIPRKKVPAGAVAIAGQQTAVYPNASPGGWHIIGQTPMKMFQLSNNSLQTVITVGDQVKFNPISYETFVDLGGELVREQK